MNIIANVRVTPATQKYRPVENDKILNFMPTTTLKNIKDTEDIPKYSFKFINIDMLSERINVDMYLSGSITDFIFFTLFLSFYGHLIILHIHSIAVIGVAAHIGQVEEIMTNFLAYGQEKP